ncbi:MAG: shikimate dehydrogenase [Deltaproteobacteria bacterium]|nr:shikimate dehydrogenase [Deltaproteobacteria bacterium]
MNFKKLDQYTELYGVLGNPVRHSLGPIMHNAAFSHKGINAVYLAFESNDIEGAVKGMRSLGIKGMSVTIPHKESVMPLLDEIDPLAREIGAVNTIVNENNKLTGYNTDATGALRALSDVIQVNGKLCVILGAGGAARAIGYILNKNSADLMIANRSAERGKALSSALNATFIRLEEVLDVEIDILINTTSVGMSPNTEFSPVSEDVLKPGMTVMDIIYNPGTTKLLHLASQKGCNIVNGLSMFINQGAEQFRLWTGKDAPVDVMKKVVEEYLYKR